MFGGSSPLRDIPEKVGYDRIFLALETSEQQSFTLVRAVSGGQFQLFDGLHETLPLDQEPIILAAKHSGDNVTNTSAFLLGKIGLLNKRVRKNKQGDTVSLSFRNLAQLCLVDESSIQKQGSPIESGQAVSKTSEYATFKLLLTGVDDSALVSSTKEQNLASARSAKLEFLDELIASYEERIQTSETVPDELSEQLRKLEGTIQQKQTALNSTDADYRRLVSQREALRKKFQEGSDRRSEIDELLARFTLLDDHYQSDLKRLEGIREAGSLIGALSLEPCPLCGAEPTHQNQAKEGCEGNLDLVVSAADAESMKIECLRDELADTVKQLKVEAHTFDNVLPRVESHLASLEKKIAELAPTISEQTSGYADLLDLRSKIRASLAIWEQIADLRAKREVLETSQQGTTVEQSVTDLSSITLDRFSQTVLEILKAWDFPEAERAYFDESSRDLVLSGKKRGSRGKGMRAITHAAFTIGLLEYCKVNNCPHPGFVVLDFPLLAYREPEGEDDDLSGTDVQNRFYDYLSKWTNRQAIIIENVDPPLSITKRETTLFLSKNPNQHRYGFFPLESHSN